MENIRKKSLTTCMTGSFLFSTVRCCSWGLANWHWSLVGWAKSVISLGQRVESAPGESYTLALQKARWRKIWLGLTWADWFLVHIWSAWRAHYRTHIFMCAYTIFKKTIYIYTTWNTYILTGRAHILWTAIKMLVESFWLLSNYLPCIITRLFFVNVTSASSFVFINHDRWKDQYLCEAKQHITAVAQVPRWFDKHWSSLKFNFLEGRRIDSVVAILDRLEFQCIRAFLCCLIMYQALFDFFATSRHPVLKAS